MEIRRGVQFFALSAVLALSTASHGQAAALGTTIECDQSVLTAVASGACHVSVHANDTVVFKMGDAWAPHDATAGTAMKLVCMDKLPAEDVAQDVTCADGLKTCTEAWSQCTVTGADATDGTGLSLAFGAAGDSTTTGFMRFVAPETTPSNNFFLDLKVLGKDDQNSAFSAAYAASTFVASSMLVAAIALF